MVERLDWLLDLDGAIIFVDEKRYYAKFEVRRASTTPYRPQGIRYSLTLHDSGTNERLIGFDNAHAVRQPRNGFTANKVLTYDHKHRHRKDKGVPYSFSSAAELVEDFWKAVDDFLEATDD